MESRIERKTITLDDGRYVQLFVNKDTRLITLDIVDADEKGGLEVYRAVAKEAK